jgi:hypothetical protein
MILIGQGLKYKKNLKYKREIYGIDTMFMVFLR